MHLYLVLVVVVVQLRPGTLPLWTLRSPCLVLWNLMSTSSWLMLSNLLIRLIVVSLIIFLAGWGCLGGFGMLILDTMLRFGFGLSFLVGLVRAGLEMEVSHRVVLLVWYSSLPCTFPGVGIWSLAGGLNRSLYADNLKCVSSDDDDLLEAARFTNTYIRLVGQAPAPSKCILLSTSAVVRGLMKDWVLSDAGDKWSVKLDTRDLGGHLDTTYRRRNATLAGRVLGLLVAVLVVMALPLDFASKMRVLMAKFLPGAVDAIEGSRISFSLLQQLRSAFVSAAWSRKMPLAHVGAVLSLLDGPPGCDPGFFVLWCRFRLLRRYLAFRPLEVPRIYSLLWLVAGGCPGHGLVHVVVESACIVVFSWNPLNSVWNRPGLPCMSFPRWVLPTFQSCHLGRLEVKGQL